MINEDSANGFYVTPILEQAVQWACYRAGRGRRGARNGAWPTVFAYRVDRVDDSHRDALTRRVYDDAGTMSVGTATPGLDRIHDVVRFCRFGLPDNLPWADHNTRRQTIEGSTHWIEGPVLRNLDDIVSHNLHLDDQQWVFGGSQVCVKTAENLGGQEDAATNLLDNSLVGLITWRP